MNKGSCLNRENLKKKNNKMIHNVHNNNLIIMIGPVLFLAPTVVDHDWLLLTLVGIQDPLPTLLFLRLPLCCFCDPLCCFCGPLCWNVFPFCWFGDPFCCFWSAKWECVLPKCHPPSRMLILYLSRINNSGPSKAKNQQFLSNKTESTNCVDQSLVGSFQDLQMIALWKLSLRRRQSSISPSFLLSFLSLL